MTGAKRSPLFPDLPTVAEAGLPGYEAELHYGLVAPAGTPPEIVAKLNAALNDALADGKSGTGSPSTARSRMPGTPEAYAADIASEEAKWSAIIKNSRSNRDNVICAATDADKGANEFRFHGRAKAIRRAGAALCA